jgi:hypothetical protein
MLEPQAAHPHHRGAQAKVREPPLRARFLQDGWSSVPYPNGCSVTRLSRCPPWKLAAVGLDKAQASCGLFIRRFLILQS